MRARLGLMLSENPVELREILLKDKPQSMLELSPKGTVPVLQLSDGQVIDESLEILLWALESESNRRLGWAVNVPSADELELVHTNDKEFKPWLDRYKYHVGYPEKPVEHYRQQGLNFLQVLNDQLATNAPHLSLYPDKIFADIAIFPFVRQFAFVDKVWFDQQPLPHLQGWLSYWLETEEFQAAMQKFAPWREGQTGIIFPEQSN